MVVSDGALAGVLDFGDLCAGDPATDLAAAWVLLPADTASRFFDAYANADNATIRRARGWAVLRAFVIIAVGVNGERGLPGGKPTWLPAGRAALERVLADAPLAREGVVHLEASGRPVDRDSHAVGGQQRVVVNDRGTGGGEADPVAE